MLLSRFNLSIVHMYLAKTISNSSNSTMRHSRFIQIHTIWSIRYGENEQECKSPNHLPSRFTHEVVRGKETGTVRCSSYSMALPAVPKGTSFFAQQEGADK